jgi:hypothetical protein
MGLTLALALQVHNGYAHSLEKMLNQDSTEIRGPTPEDAVLLEELQVPLTPEEVVQLEKLLGGLKPAEDAEWLKTLQASPTPDEAKRLKQLQSRLTPDQQVVLRRLRQRPKYPDLIGLIKIMKDRHASDGFDTKPR